MSLPGAATVKIVVAVALALALFLLIHDRNRWKAMAALRQQQLVSEQAAHLSTVANYRIAAEQARKSDAANTQRVRAEQARISERIADDYEKRIAAARARAGGLQRPAAGAAADPGRGRAAALPALSPAGRRVVEAPGEGGFPEADRLIATEQAIQLDELIKWVKRQAEVETQAGAPE